MDIFVLLLSVREIMLFFEFMLLDKMKVGILILMKMRLVKYVFFVFLVYL